MVNQYDYMTQDAMNEASNMLVLSNNRSDSFGKLIPISGKQDTGEIMETEYP